jgi:uncharacterized damage-inducible protein DinB
MQSYLERLFDHVAWADRQVLKVLRGSPAAQRCGQALRLFAHVLAAERVWLLRLRGEDSAAQAIWPELELGMMDEMSAGNAAGYTRLLRELADAELEREIEYRNSTGVPFRALASDILMHVALHGSYHRGQIARALRESGVEPVNTDYIMYIRAQQRS